MDYSDERQQHIEDTKYLTWTDGMYVMLEDLKGDHERALVENILRDSVYFKENWHFIRTGYENCLGVDVGMVGCWWSGDLITKLTRAQALYIATGDATI